MNNQLRLQRSLRLTGVAAALLLAASMSASAQDAKAVVIASGSEPATIDPCDLEANPGLVIKNNVVQSLTDIDPATGEVLPVLALSWEQKDPSTWTFKLRTGVAYQDGTPFDATAVKFGVDRALNTPEITCSDKAKVAEKLTATVVDASTVTIVTDKPSPTLPRELAFLDMPSPKTPMKEKTTVLIGTGPYTFAGWDRGQSIEIKRWDGYWGPKPEATSVKVVFRKEAQVRAGMIATGEADIAMTVPEQFSTKNDRTVAYSVNSTFFLRLPLQTTPFNDVRVRQALAYSIEKKPLVETLMGQTGIVGSQIVTSTVNAYVKDYGGFPYDPAKAKALLAEAKAAGVPIDRPVNFAGMINQFTGSDEVLQSLNQSFQAVGFKTTLQIVDAAAWAKLLFKPFPPEQTPTILSVRHRNATGDGSSTFTSYLDSNGCCASASDPKLNEMIDKARQTADPKARAAAFQDAAKYAYTQDVSLVAIADLYELLILSKRIDFKPNGQTSPMQFHVKDIHFR